MEELRKKNGFIMRACAKLVRDLCHKSFCNFPFSSIERGMIRQKKTKKWAFNSQFVSPDLIDSD